MILILFQFIFLSTTQAKSIVLKETNKDQISSFFGTFTILANIEEFASVSFKDENETVYDYIQIQSSKTNNNNNNTKEMNATATIILFEGCTRIKLLGLGLRAYVQFEDIDDSLYGVVYSDKRCLKRYLIPYFKKEITVSFGECDKCQQYSEITCSSLSVSILVVILCLILIVF